MRSLRKNYETAVAASGAIERDGIKVDGLTAAFAADRVFLSSITRNEAEIERALAAARDFPGAGHAGISILAITEERYQEWLQSKEDDEA